MNEGTKWVDRSIITEICYSLINRRKGCRTKKKNQKEKTGLKKEREIDAENLKE